MYHFQYGEFNNNPDNGGKYPIYGANGIIGGYTNFNAENSAIIGHMGAYAGYVVWASGKHFVTYNGTIAKPYDNLLDSKFGYYILFQKKIYRICAGSGQPFVSYADLNGIDVEIPKDKNEQVKIGQYFSNLDNLITLHQRKSFLNFAKRNDWEQRKLSELGEIMTGSTPSTSKSEYYSEDGIPWVTPTDINALTIFDTPKKLSKEGMKVARIVPANTILCTCIASIGKNALLTVTGSFNQQINSLTPSMKNDAYFLLTESKFWSDKMKQMAASGTMQIVNKTAFSELKAMVPTLNEQKLIGFYFRILDDLITLHRRAYYNKKGGLTNVHNDNQQHYAIL